MRVEVDPELCQGHGRCYMLAPKVFGSDEGGHSVVLVGDVPEHLEGEARLALRNCPENAILGTDSPE